MEHFLTIAVPVVCLFLVLRILTKPIRLVFKLLVNTGLGFLCLFLLNHFSAFTGVSFPINFVSAAVTGILGVPGILLMLVIGFLL